MKLSPGCCQHVGTRSEQQDVFGFSDIGDISLVGRAGAFAVLADGMGGMSMGREAAEAVVDSALAAHQQTPAGTPAPLLLQSVVAAANLRVLSVAKKAGVETGEMGATLAAVIVKDDCLHWASVGDSRIYLFRRGELVRLTEDQNLAGRLLRRVAAGTLGHAEARAHPDRAALTNYIGRPDLQPADANLRPFPLKPDDWLLLCSDGLFGTLSEEEISAELYGSPDEACERLINKTLARQRTYQDNVTTMLLSCSDKVKSAPPPAGRMPSWLSRLFFSLLVAWAAFFGGTVSVRAELPIEAMKAATVRVACKAAGSAVDYSSGFFAGNGELVVSSSHVAGCSEGGGEVAVVTAGGQRFTAEVIWTSAAKNLALLRLPGRVNVTVPPLVSGNQVADAQTVYALGFPAAAATDREGPVTISKGIINARMSIDGLRLYLTDAAITSGSSGGPLFNESGQIVGINFFRSEKSGAEGSGYAVQIDELLPELDRFGVAFRKDPVAPVAKQEPSAPRAKSTPPGGEPQIKSSPLYLAIGLAVFLAVTAIFYFLGRRGARIRASDDMAATAAVPGQMKAASPAGNRPVLIGLGGAFAGNEIRLGTELLIIGRDPQACQLVFPAGEKDIGRVHCSLRYDGKLRQFVLIDDLSINGTFLQSGERLLPETECRLLPGMRFYIASPVNMFEVRLV